MCKERDAIAHQRGMQSRTSGGTTKIDAIGNISYPDSDKAHSRAIQAENKVNGSVRTEGGRIDTFTDKNGKVVRQPVIRQSGGTIKVMKQLKQ